MNKIYISSLLIVLMAGAQSIRAQESDFDALMAEMDEPAGTGTEAMAPAAVKSAQPATVEGSTAQPAASSTQVAPDQDLYSRGVQAYNSGDYDQAVKIFEAMLGKDPYDRRAMKYLRLTADKTAAKAGRSKESFRAAAMADIDKGWTPDLSAAVAAVAQGGEKVETPENAAINAMTERLKTLRIPTLDFRDANIKDVVLFITETCRRMDEPSHKGINFLLLGLDNSDNMSGDEGNNITISVRNMSLYNALETIVEMADLKFEVRANMVEIMPVNYVRSIDLAEKEIDVISEVGDELASMAGGEESSSGGMDDLFGDTSAVAAPTGPVDVKGYFSYVQWPDQSAATYYPAFKKLIVKNTPDSIQQVQQIIDEMTDKKIRERSNQVQIEAKFVEFSEGGLKELGFDWNIYGNGSVAGFELGGPGSSYQGYQPTVGYAGVQNVNRTINEESDVTMKIANRVLYIPHYESLTGGNPQWSDPTRGYQKVVNPIDSSKGQNLFGAGERGNETAFETVTSGLLAQMGGIAPTMVFGNGDVDAKISAMEQEGTADVLSSPKVTTQSGNEAVIRVVEIHRYPQDYDVETGQRTAPVVKPQDWENFDLGVVLRVTPDVDAAAGTILLQLEPEIRKFKGFEAYEVAVNTYVTDENGAGKNLFARMPFFETRSVSTRVTVADGSTVMMGGLIDERAETYRDQVPILGDIPYVGRLFRTEGTRSEKKNLVIYVTATQVDELGMTKSDRVASSNM